MQQLNSWAGNLKYKHLRSKRTTGLQLLIFHYGGENNPYEAIKVIDAWDLGFSLGNTVKYISRAGKKGKDKELEDLRKALWYLEHHIKTIEKDRS